MQIHNVQSPNFGMALRIKPEARSAMLKSSQETLEEISKIGKELKNTRFYHLTIGKNLEPAIEKYQGDLYDRPARVTIKPFYDKLKNLENTNSEICMDRVRKPEIPNISYEMLKEQLPSTSPAVTELRKATALIKALEAKQEYETQVIETEKLQKALAEELTDRLIKSFGTEA